MTWLTNIKIATNQHTFNETLTPLHVTNLSTHAALTGERNNEIGSF